MILSECYKFCFCFQPSWRKPKGIDNRVRRRFKGQYLMPSIGYGSNKKTRHLMPDGFKKFVIHNVQVRTEIYIKEFSGKRTIWSNHRTFTTSELKKALNKDTKNRPGHQNFTWFAWNFVISHVQWTVRTLSLFLCFPTLNITSLHCLPQIFWKIFTWKLGIFFFSFLLRL